MWSVLGQIQIILNRREEQKEGDEATRSLDRSQNLKTICLGTNLMKKPQQGFEEIVKLPDLGFTEITLPGAG